MKFSTFFFASDRVVLWRLIRSSEFPVLYEWELEHTRKRCVPIVEVAAGIVLPHRGSMVVHVCVLFASQSIDFSVLLSSINLTWGEFLCLDSDAGHNLTFFKLLVRKWRTVHPSKSERYRFFCQNNYQKSTLRKRTPIFARCYCFLHSSGIFEFLNSDF